MIAKSNWFQRRKYGGWGITPKTKQGWLYILVIMAFLIIFQALPFWDDATRTIVTILWTIFLFIDLLPIIISVEKDELEYKIEAIAERNAAWTMSLILVVGLLYETIFSTINGKMQINWFIASALLGGALIKSVTNFYLEKKGLDNETKK